LKIRMKISTLFLLFLAIFTSTATSKDAFPETERSIASRIVGGQVASVGQFPYVAAVHKVTSDGSYFCGGTLLNNEWVLTAGICVESAISLVITLGTNTLKEETPNSLKLATDEYVLHPGFNPMTLDNDIGLIKFRMPITFTQYIRPVNYLPDFELLPGTPGVVAMGWGQTSDKNPDLMNDLHYVYLTPLSNEECELFYGNIVTDQIVCAGGNYNEGFCMGDSGTPLVRLRQGPTSTVVGVASFISRKGCDNSDPSGYTRTLNFVDWIRNVTGMEK
jgi:secreted trypsin-like serine protease